MKHDPDAIFFQLYSDRQAHIRMPLPRVLVRDKQRRVFYMPECDQEFRTLGDHDAGRRRIILWKVPIGNPFYNSKAPQILKIPFLAFADEDIADEDSVLLPMVLEFMKTAVPR